MKLRLALLAALFALIGASVYFIESMRQGSRVWVRMWPDRVPKRDSYYSVRVLS
jgi:hypothetical protein